jgi:hypothetical protein
MHWPKIRPESWHPPATPRRILLFGTALAGKSEILAAFAREEKLEMKRYVLGHPPTCSMLAVETAAFTIVAIVGAVWVPQEWQALIEWSTDVLHILDPQRSFAASARDLLSRFGPCLETRPRRAVQITKTDIAQNPRFASNCFELESLPAEFGLTGLLVFRSTTHEPESLTRAVRYLLAAA